MSSLDSAPACRPLGQQAGDAPPVNQLCKRQKESARLIVREVMSREIGQSALLAFLCSLFSSPPPSPLTRIRSHRHTHTYTQTHFYNQCTASRDFSALHCQILERFLLLSFNPLRLAPLCSLPLSFPHSHTPQFHSHAHTRTLSLCFWPAVVFTNSSAPLLKI